MSTYDKEHFSVCDCDITVTNISLSSTQAHRQEIKWGVFFNVDLSPTK